MNRTRYFEVMREDGIMPKRSTKYSAGYDLFLPTDFAKPQPVLPGETIFFKLGIRAAMQPDEVLLIVVRSSVGIKKGLVLSNGTGVIDSDYYGNPFNGGEICMSLRNVGHEVQYLEPGMKIAQGIFVKYLTTDDDDVSSERVGGIGSTSK